MKELVSLQAYFSEDQEIRTIFKICDLRPDGWRRWESPFGSFAQVHKIKISVRKIQNNIIPNDIYWNTHPKDLIFNTKIGAIAEDHLLMWGEDEYLRVFNYDVTIDDWRRVCPLNVSFDSLRKIVKFEKQNLTHDETQTYATVIWRFPPTTESLQYLNRSDKELCQTRLQILIEAF